MSKKTNSNIADDAPIRAKNIAAGTLGLRKRNASGTVMPAKQRVNIYLDSAIVEHFKSLAGERGYQTLINGALKDSIHAQALEKTIRHAIRQELKAYKV